MKKKKGFISVSVIYSFFIVFLLIMLSMLADYINKKYLTTGIPGPKEKLVYCKSGMKLSDCLINYEYQKYYRYDAPGYEYLAGSGVIGSDLKVNTTKVKSLIRGSDNPNTIARKPDYTKCSTSAESMYAAKDDYGTSYFYRGNVDNNYVSYAGYRWRIVRINGDGSIRLILDSGKKTAADENVGITRQLNISDLNNTKFSDVTGFFGNEETDERYVGYMYNGASSINPTNLFFDVRYQNTANSTVLNRLNNFYTRSSGLQATQNSHYTNNDNKGLNLNSIFCADKNILSKSTEVNETSIPSYTCDRSRLSQTGFFADINRKICNNSGVFSLNNYWFLKYYAALDRLFPADPNVQPSPSLICKMNSDRSMASNNCRKILNLSSYSLNNYGKYIYNVSNIETECSDTLLSGECTTHNVPSTLCPFGTLNNPRPSPTGTGTCTTTTVLKTTKHTCAGTFKPDTHIEGTCTTTKTDQYEVQLSTTPCGWGYTKSSEKHTCSFNKKKQCYYCTKTETTEKNVKCNTTNDCEKNCKGTFTGGHSVEEIDGYCTITASFPSTKTACNSLGGTDFAEVQQTVGDCVSNPMNKATCEANSIYPNVNPSWKPTNIDPLYITLKNYYSFTDASASRATNKNETTNLGNGALAYPIGLISADEVVMSGSSITKKDDVSKECYSSLYSDTFTGAYWTGSAAAMDNKFIDLMKAKNGWADYIASYKNTDDPNIMTFYMAVNNASGNSYIHLYKTNDPLVARPVINIDKNYTVSGELKGNGTYNNPYQL